MSNANQTENNMSNIENITFGVELETTIPVGQPFQIGGYHNGLPVLCAPQFNGKAWKAERDGSIQTALSNHVACEFVSPVLQGEAGVQHLIDFVAWLNSIGAKVNASCGCHIHIGVASFASDRAAQAKFVKILARLTTRNATALYAQTGSISRESGRFCKKAQSDDRKTITRACRAANLNALSNDRYQLLNLTNVTTRGTVEFRCFAGTLNIDKILAHLLSVLLLAKVAAARKSLTAWDATEVLSGTQSLHNLLKVRPVCKIVSAAPFQARKDAIIAKAFEMAAKYDAAKAAQPLSPAHVAALFSTAAR